MGSSEKGPPVRLGVIGFGIMGERLVNNAAGLDPASVTIAGVWDPSAAAMARLAETLPAIPQMASAEAAMAAADCLYIATPPATHLDYARQAQDQGLAVFTEKPLAVDLEAARAFVAAAESAGLRAAVNFVFASSPGVEQLGEWLDAGRIGDPRGLEIEIAFAAWPRPWQADAVAWLDRRVQGGFTREVISHFLFLSRRLLGPLTLSEGSIDYPADGTSERGLTARLTAGGLPVTLRAGVGSTDKPDHNRWTLAGSQGAIRLCDWSRAELRQADGAWAQAPNAMANEKARPLILHRQLHKIAALTRGQPHNLASLREALEVQEVVEALLAL